MTDSHMEIVKNSKVYDFTCKINNTFRKLIDLYGLLYDFVFFMLFCMLSFSCRILS